MRRLVLSGESTELNGLYGHTEQMNALGFVSLRVRRVLGHGSFVAATGQVIWSRFIGRVLCQDVWKVWHMGRPLLACGGGEYRDAEAAHAADGLTLR